MMAGKVPRVRRYRPPEERVAWAERVGADAEEDVLQHQRIYPYARTKYRQRTFLTHETFDDPLRLPQVGHIREQARENKEIFIGTTTTGLDLYALDPERYPREALALEQLAGVVCASGPTCRMAFVVRKPTKRGEEPVEMPRPEDHITLASGSKYEVLAGEVRGNVAIVWLWQIG